MGAAQRDRFREERLYKDLVSERAELRSELESAEYPRKLGLRLEIQACELLLEQIERVRAAQPSTRRQALRRS
jgi:hypothetical protein